MTPHPRTLVLIVFAFLFGCDERPLECRDCGPCGMVGGSNAGDWIAYFYPGLEARDRVVVPLNVWRGGECESANGEYYHLVWEGSSYRIDTLEHYTSIDETMVDYDGHATYHFTDRALAVVLGRVSEREVRVSFETEATTTALTCWLDAEVGGNLLCGE